MDDSFPKNCIPWSEEDPISPKDISLPRPTLTPDGMKTMAKNKILSNVLKLIEDRYMKTSWKVSLFDIPNDVRLYVTSALEDMGWETAWECTDLIVRYPDATD